jgi:pectate lyase
MRVLVSIRGVCGRGHLLPRAFGLCLALALPAAHGRVGAAFPGAEGYGANAKGGRGGEVYYVTTVEDYGPGRPPIPGSLRFGIASARKPRTILFKVSGNIQLKANLDVGRPRLTIAGQSAPGDGICLQDYPLVLKADDLIVQHLRSRLGTNASQQADAISIVSGSNIIADHCSASWSVDETLSPTDRVQDLTVQWTFITESLNESIHKKGPHGYGSLMRPRIDARYTFHHNLYAHHSSRNPRPGSYDRHLLRLDFRNNVIYDWGFKAGYNNYPEERVEMNYAGNYLLSGPSTTFTRAIFESAATNTFIWQSGNLFDVNRNGKPDGQDRDWEVFTGKHQRVSKPFPAPPVTTDTAPVAMARVLAQAGAMPWHRDPVDARVAESARRETGRIINCTAEAGGWPRLAPAEPPADSDGDGLPDGWEECLGLNPRSPADGNSTTAEGYTRLEEYLHWLAEPHASTHANTPLSVDLPALNGNSGDSLAFSAGDASHGTVTIDSATGTARFVPAHDFTGKAPFCYYATDRLLGARFGPVTVRVLVMNK